MEYLSKEITKALDGVHPEGRPIIATERVISGALFSVENQYAPKVGDIHSRYIIPQDPEQNDLTNINSQVIAMVVDAIKNEYEIAQNNSKLSIWSTLYGEGCNDEGLKQTNLIKLNNRRPMSGFTCMRY
jgi:hypothetical protein